MRDESKMKPQSGSALRGLKLAIRMVQFLCAAIIFSIFSYFLAALSNHALPTPTWVRAVEGISGIAVLYSLACFLILYFKPGAAAAHPATSLASMVADVAFAAAFIYVASANHGGAGSCTGFVETPFGSGDAETGKVEQGSEGFTALPGNLGVACRLETACLAVAIVGLFFFLFSPVAEAALIRHYRHERRLGNPSPITPEDNPNETMPGAPPKPVSFFSRLFRRKQKNENKQKDTVNPNALPEHVHPDDVRNSYGTDQTRVGTANDLSLSGSPGGYKYETLPQHQQQQHQGYTGVAPGGPEGYGQAYGGEHDLGYGDGVYGHETGYGGHGGHQGQQQQHHPGHDTGIAGNGNEARWDEVPLASFPPANYRYSDGVYDRV